MLSSKLVRHRFYKNPLQVHLIIVFPLNCQEIMEIMDEETSEELPFFLDLSILI
jgi:hypothetical protein